MDQEVNFRRIYRQGVKAAEQTLGMILACGGHLGHTNVTGLIVI
jgi:hypothetical protein